MASKTTTFRVDDINPDITEGVDEVKFGLYGVEYVIDLGKDNQQALEDTLEPFLAAARKVSGRNGKPVAVKASARTDLAAVRAWAVEHGYQVAERGRVAQSVLDAYDNAA